jgi:hypothetical protein
MTGAKRSLDHFIVVTSDLNAAAVCYQRLGFRVLPLMEHAEIGTSNTVIQFQDTYLELLGDFDQCKVAMLAEKVRPRLEAGDGMFMTSFTSANLEVDRPIIEATGVTLTAIVSARRRVRLPRSGWGETDSRSMYAWNEARLLMSAFLSDHRKPEMIWIPEYQMHPNTVERVTTLTYVAAAPQLDVDYYAKLLGSQPKISADDQVIFETPRGEVFEILAPARCRKKYGRSAPEWIPSLGGYGVGYAFLVSDLDRCRWALRDGGVPFEEQDAMIRVGQPYTCGAVLEFRQAAEAVASQ